MEKRKSAFPKWLFWLLAWVASVFLAYGFFWVVYPVLHLPKPKFSDAFLVGTIGIGAAWLGTKYELK
ncbi:MAG: hypothetical protein M3Y13_08640 [Armatimonadota bacterium]|nr:hypothetical protein [Armatimonadota bacterium]